VLALLRRASRFSLADEGGELARRLAALGESLRCMDDEVEGRLSRALVQAENSRDALRSRLAVARRQAEHLAPAAETDPLPVDPV